MTNNILNQIKIVKFIPRLRQASTLEIEEEENLNIMCFFYCSQIKIQDSFLEFTKCFNINFYYQITEARL